MNERIKPETKLPQWHALLLESLKGYGWSNEELIRRVEAGELPKDKSAFQFDYADLVAFASEQRERFAAAVNDGYAINYNTLRGIHSWIRVAFRTDAELHLEPGAEAIGASLTEGEIRKLESVLSFGWKLTVLDSAAGADGRRRVGIEPVHRM